MQVDFYQLSRDPVQMVLPAIAAKVLENDARLLIVDGRPDMLGKVSEQLWARDPASFLAHDVAGGDHPDRQPILLAECCDAANGATHIALSDGIWRDEALRFARAFYFFDAQTLDGARSCWKKLKATEGVEPRFWRQDGRKWVQGP